MFADGQAAGGRAWGVRGGYGSGFELAGAFLQERLGA